MPSTANVLQRTFYICYGNNVATCFTLDRYGKQYIITARHNVASISTSSTIGIQRNGTWEGYNVNLVGHSSNDVDITVLAPDRQLSPTPSLPPLPDVEEGVSLGQDILFLGFPYELTNEAEDINRGFPFALIKHGILSAVLKSGKSGENRILLLDGRSNPGFSGGPVVCELANSQSSGLAVIGVISGFKPEHKSIYYGQSETPFSYKDNTGIICAGDINHALDLIDKNPIGFDLSASQFRAWLEHFRPYTHWGGGVLI